MTPIPEKFSKGVDLFNQGLYFEAHEIWEEAWNDSEGTEKRFLQALIQIAVALLKWQSGIPGGAIKMHKMAMEKLSALPDRCLGCDVRRIEREFHGLLKDLVEKDRNLPFPMDPIFRL